MTKSEENANIAYPITRGSGIDHVISMVNKRNGYIQGYEQAKKDIIETITGWIDVRIYNPYNGDGYDTALLDLQEKLKEL